MEPAKRRSSTPAFRSHQANNSEGHSASYFQLRFSNGIREKLTFEQRNNVNSRTLSQKSCLPRPGGIALSPGCSKERRSLRSNGYPARAVLLYVVRRNP
jgi:hypothetical protein